MYQTSKGLKKFCLKLSSGLHEQSKYKSSSLDCLHMKCNLRNSKSVSNFAASYFSIPTRQNSSSHPQRPRFYSPSPLSRQSDSSFQSPKRSISGIPQRSIDDIARRETQDFYPFQHLWKSLNKHHITPNPDTENFAGTMEQRRWSYTQKGLDHLKNQEAGLDFTLMSYNVLSQHLLEDNFHLYVNCDPTFLEWGTRKEILLEEIKEANADILCFQEVQDEHYINFFLPELGKLGYASEYKKRTTDKVDGCALFYKKSLFTLEAIEKVEFLRDDVKMLNRDNVGLIAMLRPNCIPKEKNMSLCVTTTHLLFNPKRGDIKLLQLMLLLAEIDKMAFKGIDSKGNPVYNPIILCGDMNSEPMSPLYKFISNRCINIKGLKDSQVSGQGSGQGLTLSPSGKEILLDSLINSKVGVSSQSQYTSIQEQRQSNGNPSNINPLKVNTVTSTSSPSSSLHSCVSTQDKSIKHNFEFVSAYQHVNEDGLTEVTTHHNKANCTVDYIFYSVDGKNTKFENGKTIQKELSEGPLVQLGSYNLLTSENAKKMGSLPNAFISSDHISLVARFLLKMDPSN